MAKERPQGGIKLFWEVYLLPVDQLPVVLLLGTIYVVVLSHLMAYTCCLLPLSLFSYPRFHFPRSSLGFTFEEAFQVCRRVSVRFPSPLLSSSPLRRCVVVVVVVSIQWLAMMLCRYIFLPSMCFSCFPFFGFLCRLFEVLLSLLLFWFGVLLWCFVCLLTVDVFFLLMY